MPVVLRLDGFKFHFYANEGNPREPAHIHVRQGRDEAKFWLTPMVVMAYMTASTPGPSTASSGSSSCTATNSKGHGMSISPRLRTC